MRLIKGFRGSLLLKGDGNQGFHPVTGLPFVYQNHPEELMWGNHEGSHEHGFDRPMYSHYGEHGVPKGQWGKGVHGEHVWRDEFGIDHMHGIDGIIRKVGNMLESYGKQQIPKEVVQEAIDRYNSEREKRNDTEHLLPDVDSPEWRQLRYGHFEKATNKDGSLRMGIRGSHGNEEEGSIQHDRLKTINTNSNFHHALGKFGESYTIPFAYFLKDILIENGLQIGIDDEGITRPYISVDDLAINPETGDKVGYRIRPKDNKKNEYSDDFYRKFNIVPPEMAIGEIHPWQIIHHLPDIFYKKGGGGRKTEIPPFVNEIANLRHHINSIPPELLDKVAMKTAAKDITLRDIITNDKLSEKAVEKLAETPAILHMLLGDTTQGHAKKAVNELKVSLEKFAKENNRPDLIDDFNMFRSHVIGGKIRTGYQSGRGKSSHDTAADLFAFANLMGEDPENPGVSILRNAVEHELSLHENVEGQEHLATLFADALSHRYGHEPRRNVLTAEEMPSTSYAGRTRNVERVDEFPQHIDDYFIHTQNPVASLQTAPPTTTKLTTTPTETTPPPPPREEAQLAKPPPQLPAQTPAQPPAPVQQPAQPSDAELMAARRAFQYATPQQARRVYVARTGLGQEGRAAPDFTSPEAQQRLAAFQSAIADPYQQTLTPFMKSEDAQNRLIKAMENIQMKAANLNPDVKKLLPSSSLNMNKEEDISYMAQKMGIAKNDIRTILLSKGDWQRVSNTFDINPVIVKAVKLAFRSDSNE